MALAGKVSSFYREGNDWFCRAGLPSDITVSVEGINFHLHKFPLISKSGRIAQLYEESRNSSRTIFKAALEHFPGGPEIFFIVAKFCYGSRVELTPTNIITLYCAADYLEMTDKYGEDNLISKSESYLHNSILRHWKDCIIALQSAESVIISAEKLQILRKCLDSLSVMACTDPSLFGWPMMMYGSLQSPGGSILWNGINTGARIRSSESDWWFEDVSYLGVNLFDKLIKAMQARGLRPESLVGAIMYYARKYLPGLSRWHGRKCEKPRTVMSFGLTPAIVDQRILLETIEKLLPFKKGKSFCRFLLALLRVALILGVDRPHTDSLERRIGMQLELATLDGLLIPSYSDSETLYDTGSVERIVRHFTSSQSMVTAFSPASFDLEPSPGSGPLKKVARLLDGYLAEVASDVNLKAGKLRSLAEAIPDSARPFHDGLYRALDIYFKAIIKIDKINQNLKAHPCLSTREREELCNIIHYQKLSIDACAHASKNERLPLRVVLQVLFFEQLQLRMALAGCHNAMDSESAIAAQAEMTGQIVQRDGWVTVVRENQVLKLDLENMRSRVRELEQELTKIKEEMKRAAKSHSSISSPRWSIGCKLLPRLTDARSDIVESVGPSPRASVEQRRPSRLSEHRKTFSLF